MSIKEYLLNLKKKLGFLKKEEGKSVEKILLKKDMVYMEQYH